MALKPIPGRPGFYHEEGAFNPDGSPKIVKLTEQRNHTLYDTIFIPTGASAAGNQYVFFQNVQGKNEVFTNLVKSSQIGNGQVMEVREMGLYCRQATGNVPVTPADWQRVLDNTFFRFEVDRNLMYEAPAYTMPTGYGLTGSTTQNNSGVVTLGAASTAAVRPLAERILITDTSDLRGLLRFETAANWYGGAGFAMPTIVHAVGLFVTFHLDGVLATPLGTA